MIWWILGIAAIAVIGFAFLTAAGRFGAAPKWPDDRPGPDLPEGELTGEDLREVAFAVTSRGYSMKQVDALLARLANQLDPAVPDEVADLDGGRESSEVENGSAEVESGSAEVESGLAEVESGSAEVEIDSAESGTDSREAGNGSPEAGNGSREAGNGSRARGIGSPEPRPPTPDEDAPLETSKSVGLD